jgi:hypothetical protein
LALAITSARHPEARRRLSSMAWPPLIGVYVNGCEGSISLILTARTLLGGLGGAVADWTVEPFHPLKSVSPCVQRQPAVRLRCLRQMAVATNATYVFKVNKKTFEQSRKVRAAYRTLGIPVLTYARQSPLEFFACAVRDCFDEQSGGESAATLVDASGRRMSLCRRFNVSQKGARGPADATRASIDAGARVRIMTKNSRAFCARLRTIRASKSLAARVWFLQRQGIDPRPAPATFEQLHIDTNRPRRAAAWADWLAHGVPAVAAMQRKDVETAFARLLPPPPSPPPRSVWDQFEDPGAVRALAQSGRCARDAF